MSDPRIKTSAADIIIARTGRIDGTNGADTLDLRHAISSTVHGGSGDDTYIFGRGAGQDVIVENDNRADWNIIKITGISSSAVKLSRGLDSGGGVTDDLVISIAGTTDTLTAKDYFAGNYPRIGQVIFDDGTVLGTRQMDRVEKISPGTSISIGTDNDDAFDLRNTDNREVSGNRGNDTYFFGAGAGQDMIFDYGGVDTIRITGVSPSELTLSRGINSGRPGIFKEIYNLVISINGTDDTLTVEDYFVVDGTYPGIIGGIYKIEQIIFDDGTVWGASDLDFTGVILPGAGETQGTTDNDTFDLRNPVNTTVHGGAGNDTYHFGRGAGQDVIVEQDDTPGNMDTIRITGLKPSEVTLSRRTNLEREEWRRVTNDLIISINGTSDTLIVKDYFSNSANKIEQVIFDDGTVWRAAKLNAAAVLPGEGDTIGTGSGETFDLRNAASSTIHGWLGNDTYLFGRGAGQDVINDHDSTPGGNTDTIKITGLDPSEVTVSRRIDLIGRLTNDLVISINGTTDTLIVNNYFSGDANKIEQVIFDDGTVWGTAKLDTAGVIVPEGMFANTLGDDIFDLRKPVNSTVDGGAGNDTYLFSVGAGQDSIVENDDTPGNMDIIRMIGVKPSEVTLSREIDLIGRLTNDLVISINGTTDTLIVNNYFSGDANKIEQVIFDDGTVWGTAKLDTAGVIVPEGMFANTLGDDIFDLRKPVNSTVDGGAGNDTYLFSVGAGQDSIVENDDTPGNMDIIRMIGVKPSEVTLSREIDLIGRLTNDLVISINGTTDTLIVNNYFSGDANKIEQVIFDDGTVWGTAKLDTAGVIVPEGMFANTLGDDIFDLRKPVNSTVDGGAGNDTYLFSVGAGQDSIVENDDTPGNMDIIRMIGVKPSEVTLSREIDLIGRLTNDLVISINGTTDTLIVNNYFSGDANKIEQVIFDDGTVWGTAKLDTAGVIVPEGMFANTLGDDIFDLRKPVNSTVYGGGFGNDIYIFGRGAGQDVINDRDYISGNTDIIKITDLNPSEVTVSRRIDLIGRLTNDLVISINGTTDTLIVNNYFSGDANKIEQVIFDDGTVWKMTELGVAVVIVPEGAFANTPGDDTFDFSNPASTIVYGTGAQGNDTYLFGRDAGQDTIYDLDYTQNNKDTLEFLSGIDADQLWLRQDSSGYDLEISIIGTEDKVTIRNWYLGSGYHVEEFTTSDGKTLMHTQVDNLVQAMAAFAPPASGETTLPDDYQRTLDPVIAANWQ